MNEMIPDEIMIPLYITVQPNSCHQRGYLEQLKGADAETHSQTLDLFLQRSRNPLRRKEASVGVKGD